MAVELNGRKQPSTEPQEADMKKAAKKAKVSKKVADPRTTQREKDSSALVEHLVRFSKKHGYSLMAASFDLARQKDVLSDTIKHG